MQERTFRGGIHPHDSKERTAELPIESAQLPKAVAILMAQHIGAPCSPIVAVGDQVKTGQKIGDSSAPVSAPVHSSISGTVVGIARTLSPSGSESEAVVIESDGKDEWVELEERENYDSLSGDELRDIIRNAGLVGLGGACFPTHFKLKPNKPVDTLVINGAECEPYLTCDYRIMLEKPEEVIAGIRIMMKVLGVKKAIVGIENNKPKAGQLLDEVVADDTSIEIVPLQTKYPQGAEKMLITALTGREVPSGGLPADVGIVVQNSTTCQAVYQAVRFGRPLIDKIVTVTGYGIKNAKNLQVRIGTTLRSIIDQCDGFVSEPGKIVMGGPMMGIAQISLDVPLIKGSSGLIVFPKNSVQATEEENCLRCGKCIDICAMRLMPVAVKDSVKAKNWVQARENNANDCCECGSCAYVCPAGIPLVQYFRVAKNEIRNLK